MAEARTLREKADYFRAMGGLRPRAGKVSTTSLNKTEIRKDMFLPWNKDKKTLPTGQTAGSWPSTFNTTGGEKVEPLRKSA